MAQAVEAGEVRGRRAETRLLLTIVVSAILVVMINQTFTNVVVPDIRNDFGATQGQVGWVITGYLLVFAVGVPLYGRVADLYSLRRVFVFGLLVFAAGSLVCALAPSLPLLVAGRVVQAAGAAAIPALGFASVAKALPPGERGAALGLLASSVGVGGAIGPVLGGAVASLAGWQVLFYLTLVLALVLVPAALRVLPGAPEVNRKPPGLVEAVHHFDMPGAAALALAAGLALFGVTEGQVAGFGSPIVWGSFGLALAAAAFFIRRIRRAAEPFVSPGLFRNAGFLVSAGVGFFTVFAYLGSLVLAPLMLSEINGLSAAGIGLALAPSAAVIAALSPVAGRLSDRFGPRHIVQAGLIVVAVSMFFVSAVGTGASAILVTAGLLGIGVGFAAVNSPTANAATAVLPLAESGVGLGIYQMFFYLGGGFGPALGATFLAFRQEAHSGALNPLYAASGNVPFSDAFLLLVVSALIALAASFALPGKEPAKESDEEE